MKGASEGSERSTAERVSRVKSDEEIGEASDRLACKKNSYL